MQFYLVLILDEYILGIISLLFLLFVLFVGYETAYIAVYQSEEDFNREKLSGVVRFFFNHPQQLIITLLIGKILSLSLSIYFTYSFILNHFDTKNTILFFIVLTILLSIILILLGDYLPKVLFRRKQTVLLQIFAWLIGLFFIVFYPITQVINWLASKSNTNKKDIYGNTNIFSLVNLNYLLSENSSTNEVFSGIDNEVRIIQNVLDLSNVKLRDCLVPRTDMVALKHDADIQTLKQMFIETGLSKILVYKKDLDNIIGYIHSSELFKNPKDWSKQINPIPIVPESMSAQKLMQILMREKKSIAVVVDEFGGTSGIVTLEDIMEEIFGEIEDEHDVRSHTALKTGENEYLLSGKLEVEEINEMFHLDIPVSEDYSTLAGFILQEYQHIPKLNEVIRIDNYVFKFLKVSSNRIELVKMVIES